MFRLQLAPQIARGATRRVRINATIATVAMSSAKPPRPPLIPGAIVSYRYVLQTQWICTAWV